MISYMNSGPQKALLHKKRTILPSKIYQVIAYIEERTAKNCA